MSKKPSKPPADELKPFVAPFRFDGSGQFHLKSRKTNDKGGLTKEEGEEIIEANRKRLIEFPGKALRAGPLVAAADLPGHGRRRQGFCDQGGVRGRQPAGLRGHLVQAAVDQGARPRFHVAGHDRAAPTRPHRHLQPFLLRGMHRGARAQGDSRQGEAAAETRHQKHLARTVRGHCRDRALPRAQRHRGPEVLPQRLQARAAPALP